MGRRMKPSDHAVMATGPAYQPFRDKVITEVRTLVREFRERGWPEPLFGPMDEPKEKDAPLLKSLRLIVNQGGGKTSTQMPHNSTDLKWLDVLDYPLSYNNWFSLSRCRELRKRGIPNQSWRGCWGHRRIRSVSRGESGLMGLHCGVDAIQYAFWNSSRMCPESDLDNVGWPVEMTAGYMRDGGVISSLHTEVLRTGRDDARYAAALRRLIAKAKEDPARKALAQETQSKLDRMLHSLVKSPDTFLGSERSMEIDWDALRAQLKNWALALEGHPVTPVRRLPDRGFSGEAVLFKPSKQPKPKIVGTPAPPRLADAARGGWKLQFADDFERADLGGDWKVISGSWAIEKGRLVNHRIRGESQIVCMRRFPGSQRLEFDAASDKPGDLTGLLGIDETGFRSGYFFGFGSDANAFTKLLVRGGEAQTCDARATPGEVHHVVCQREGSLLTLIIDGKVVMAYQDKRPLTGKGHERVGFYVWMPGRLDNVKAFAKP